ncbi:MAG: cysteine desulfurase [Bacilli bacterium]|nr:cysteine desulfurase [Bacilli bacterium]MDD4076538.1 cysteine desulfurase family protein [Bacilli bacterium]MDD4387858.1 cysteine desulfurase family protein [Bacilli bacterium]
MIYLDYTATTPIDQEVLDTYTRVEKDFFANVSSMHKLGQRSNYLFEKAKSEIKDMLNLKQHYLIFTGSASEANNLAILGIVRKYPQGKIITTKIEHSSVYAVYQQLESEGYTVKYLDVDTKGIINLQQLASYLDNDTVLVSIMWVNNIIGSIQPIDKVIEIIKNYPKVKLHVDGVQGLCKIIPDFNFEKIDLLTFSAHKIYGPKGIGLLAFKENIELKKITYGSTVQYNIRPGTVDLAAVAALCKAIKKYYPQTKKHYLIVKQLNNYLRKKLQRISGIIINSSPDASPYVFNISIPGHNGETIVHFLGNNNIYVSAGSACSSKLKRSDRIVLNVSKSEDFATSSIRISLSHLTTYQEIDKLIEILLQVN